MKTLAKTLVVRHFSGLQLPSSVNNNTYRQGCTNTNCADNDDVVTWGIRTCTVGKENGAKVTPSIYKQGSLPRLWWSGGAGYAKNPAYSVSVCLLMLESWHIQHHQTTLNRERGTLPELYAALLDWTLDPFVFLNIIIIIMVVFLP